MIVRHPRLGRGRMDPRRQRHRRRHVQRRRRRHLHQRTRPVEAQRRRRTGPSSTSPPSSSRCCRCPTRRPPTTRTLIERIRRHQTRRTRRRRRRRGAGHRRVPAQVPRRVDRPHPVAVRRRRGQPGVAERWSPSASRPARSSCSRRPGSAPPGSRSPPRCPSTPPRQIDLGRSSTALAARPVGAVGGVVSGAAGSWPWRSLEYAARFPAASTARTR